MTASQGQNVELSCTVSGDPPPAVTWYYNNNVVPNKNTTDIILEDDNATLTFAPVLNSHEGKYVCMVDNGIGQDNDSIALNVLG